MQCCVKLPRWKSRCEIIIPIKLIHFIHKNFWLWNLRYFISCTSKSRRASSWFWMIGRVFISFSMLILRITPSVLRRTYKWCEVTHSWNWQVWPQLYTFKGCRSFCSNAAICLIGFIKEYFPRAGSSPSLHLGEISCNESVGQSPLGQIPAVTSNVDGHIIT